MIRWVGRSALSIRLRVATTRNYSATTGQSISTNDGAGNDHYEYYPATHTNAGRLKSQTNAAGKKIYFNYNSRGEMCPDLGRRNLSD